MDWLSFIPFIGSALITLIIGYYINRINQVKRKLADFIAANPETTAIAAYTVDAEGKPVPDGYTLFHNADDPLVVASTMKIIILAAYAAAITEGDLQPNEPIPIAEVEKYYLPMTDGGAHQMGLKSMGLAADDKGFALDQSARITLDDIARIMMHYSGNAETDYLLVRLGPERLAEVMQKAGLEHHTPISCTLGVVLAMFNHETPTFTVEQLRQAGEESYRERLTALYGNDPQWRTAQITFMASILERLAAAPDSWAYQTAASQLFPKGTAREYAHLMAQIVRGRFISPEVSHIMQQKLETVPSDWPLRLLFYQRFGAKDGTTSGVLTTAAYAVPRRGILKKQCRVIVLIATHMPPELWLEQLQYQGHYLLPVDLAQVSGSFDRLAPLFY